MEVDEGGWTLIASIADDNNNYWLFFIFLIVNRILSHKDYLKNGNLYGNLANYRTNDY